jgi:hypothetical protein
VANELSSLTQLRQPKGSSLFENGLWCYYDKQMCQFATSAHLIASKTRTLRRLAPDDRKLVFAALALLTAIKIALWTLSFQRVTRFVKRLSHARPIHRGFNPRQVVWAVQLASRYVPRATCLPQALTTQILLSWHGHMSRLHIGVALAQKFEAHVWVECDGRVVIREAEEIERYTPILGMETGHLKN